MIDPKGHIILDRFETWPNECIEILKKARRDLEAYFTEVQKVDHVLCYGELEERLNYQISPPTNPYREAYAEAAANVQPYIRELPVIGFHCTRLTRPEIQSIQANGLIPLSSEHANHRIGCLVDDGVLSSAQAQILTENNDSGEESRSGKVYFFHAQENLDNEGGLYKLFRFWGGEALYRRHKAISPLSALLRTIGEPCIVMGSLTYEEMEWFYPFEQRLVNAYSRNYCPWIDDQDFDGRARRTVSVLEVIERNDSRFEQLTHCSQWDEQI